MKTTKPQPVNRKQVEQFLASAQNKSVAAKKNLAIDAEAAYQIAYEAYVGCSLYVTATSFRVTLSLTSK